MKVIQYYHVFLLCAFGKILSNADIQRSSCRRSGIFQLVAQNARLDASVIATVVAHTLLMCSMKCVNDLICKSINYNKHATRCEKLSESRLNVGESKIIATNSWDHYEPEHIKDQLPTACHRNVTTYHCGALQKSEVNLTQTKGYKCVDLQNIALGKATKHRPEDDDDYPSSRAVDGNHDTSLCSRTNCCWKLPWWMVDFGSNALVYSIKITNRGDCCGERLSNFNVRVGDSSFGRGEHNTLCQQNISVPEGQTSTFICSPPLHGRYLYVQTNLRYRLSLCEVEVYGENPLT